MKPGEEAFPQQNVELKLDGQLASYQLTELYLALGTWGVRTSTYMQSFVCFVLEDMKFMQEITVNKQITSEDKMRVPFVSEMVAEAVQDLLEPAVFPADFVCFLFLVGAEAEELWTRSAVDAWA